MPETSMSTKSINFVRPLTGRPHVSRTNHELPSKVENGYIDVFN
jgi:hypothetical protein